MERTAGDRALEIFGTGDSVSLEQHQLVDDAVFGLGRGYWLFLAISWLKK